MNKTKKVIVISAVGKNNEIGFNNKLLFRYKSDMKNFKNETNNNIVIMGRKTFESLNSTPLPNRLNIVVSHNENLDAKNNVIWKTSLEEALEYAQSLNKYEKIFIIGGGSIYKECFEKKYVDEIILTNIDREFPEADTYFPNIDYTKWKCYLIRSMFEEGFRYNINYYWKI